VSERILVSEQVGQVLWRTERGHDRLEFTEYGAGDSWVVLLPFPLQSRRGVASSARALADAGLHVVTLDPLGHGRSDRPADPLVYSTTAFAEQVVALLDHLDAPQAVVGGVSLGADVALEVAVLAPERVRGLLLERPVLHNALQAGLVTGAPLLFAARFLPFLVTGARLLSRPVPRRPLPAWTGRALDGLDQQPAPLAAMLHGLLFGRVAPPVAQRRAIDAPALVVGHAHDPWHPLADARMLADELPRATFEQAGSLVRDLAGDLIGRSSPERLDLLRIRFARDCWRGPVRRARRAGA
jgi:pimeloyl-ACP methyl ester carboxylesterase